MRSFRGLEVWQKAHKLTLQVYRETDEFPRKEQFGLAVQMRRASSSIPTNIAEGCGRRSQAELAHFLSIAMGSASELEYQLLLSTDLGYLQPGVHKNLEDQVTGVRQMLTRLASTVRRSHGQRRADGR